MLNVYFIVVCLLEYTINLICMVILTDEEENCASQLPSRTPSASSGMCISTQVLVLQVDGVMRRELCVCVSVGGWVCSA